MTLRSARAAFFSRVNRNWCMCVVAHDYGVLGGGRDGDGGW